MIQTLLGYAEIGSNLSPHIFRMPYHATSLIRGVRYSADERQKERIAYGYDDNGNISEVTENGVLTARYEYDSLNRLVREDNAALGTTLYEYDGGGNILSKRTAAFTSDKCPFVTDCIDYTYGTEGWGDRLLSFGGESIGDYDAVGNPGTYRGNAFAWTQGRRLRSVMQRSGGKPLGVSQTSFSYNASGIRTSKTSGGVTTEYLLSGDGDILAEIRAPGLVGTSRLDYLSGTDGVTGFSYTRTVGSKPQTDTYFYRKNVQGDVIQEGLPFL